MAEKILILEDEPSILSILCELLKDAGYEVKGINNGADGLAEFRSGDYDLILLDIMMPKLDGYGVCNAVREVSDVPIIAVTALDDEEAQVRAFELKADDYITKPFSLKLVLMRVEAVLRRASLKGRTVHSNSVNCSQKEKSLLRSGSISLEPENMRVFKGKEEITLTRTEFEIMKLLMESQNRVFTRDNLLNTVWGYDFAGEEKTVNIHIMNLRKKLGENCIETIRGVGYRLGKN